VRESDAQALQWFERAARQGLAEAQFHLGNMYAYGLAALPAGADGARLAAQWYFEAARQGHADSQYSLGILFLTGSGVTQSADEAARWIGRAAAQGHADASAYVKAAGTPAARP
jgi:TPR repeat protein